MDALTPCYLQVQQPLPELLHLPEKSHQLTRAAQIPQRRAVELLVALPSPPASPTMLSQLAAKSDLQ